MESQGLQICRDNSTCVWSVTHLSPDRQKVTHRQYLSRNRAANEKKKRQSPEIHQKLTLSYLKLKLTEKYPHFIEALPRILIANLSCHGLHIHLSRSIASTFYVFCH